MQSDSDLITLPFTPDLTRAGIAYACRSLAHTYDRMGGSSFERLRRIAGGVAVELAFLRYLVSQGVPYDTLGMTPFTDPDHYDVALGGRRCDIKSFLIVQKNKIRRIRKDPSQLLQAAALVPIDQVGSDHLHDKDLYIFAFTTALVAHKAEDVERARRAGQPFCFVYPFPETWTRNAGWISLGKPYLKAEMEGELQMELGGQAKNHDFQAEQLKFLPQTRIQTQKEYYSLAYLSSDQIPGGRVGIHSPSRNSTLLVTEREWENIWVYGMEIFLAGYITRGEFRRRAQPLPAGSRVEQYARTRTDNLTLPISELYPIGDLLRRVKEWYRDTKPKFTS